MEFLTLLFLVAYFSIDSQLVHPAKTSTCQQFSLLHGSVNLTTYPYARRAYLKCNKPYVLIGPKWITCDENGEWNLNSSVCARQDCPKLASVIHGNVHISQGGALASVLCDMNFQLVGSGLLYCNDLSEWSDTLPQCMADELERFSPCHFEKKDYIWSKCHWYSKPSTSYRWIEYTPEQGGPDYAYEDAMFLPIVDNTKGTNEGTYLTLVGRSSKTRKKAAGHPNMEAKFISPLVPPTVEANEQLCFVFYTHTGRFNPSVVLEVLIDEKVVWRKPVHNIDRHNWTRRVIDLRNQSKPFRVTLVAVTDREKPFQEIPGIAVDDLGLITGERCGFNDSQRSSNETMTVKTAPTSFVDEYDAREHYLSPGSITPRANTSVSSGAASNISTADFGALPTKTNDTTTSTPAATLTRNTSQTRPAYVTFNTTIDWSRSRNITNATDVSPTATTTRDMNLSTAVQSVDGHLFSSSQIPEHTNVTKAATESQPTTVIRVDTNRTGDIISDPHRVTSAVLLAATSAPVLSTYHPANETEENRSFVGNVTTELTTNNLFNGNYELTKDEKDHFYSLPDYNDEYYESYSANTEADELIDTVTRISEEKHYGSFIKGFVILIAVTLLTTVGIFATKKYRPTLFIRRNLPHEDMVYFINAEANSDEEVSLHDVPPSELFGRSIGRHPSAVE